MGAVSARTAAAACTAEVNSLRLTRLRAGGPSLRVEYCGSYGCLTLQLQGCVLAPRSCVEGAVGALHLKARAGCCHLASSLLLVLSPSCVPRPALSACVTAILWYRFQSRAARPFMPLRAPWCLLPLWGMQHLAGYRYLRENPYQAYGLVFKSNRV